MRRVHRISLASSCCPFQQQRALLSASFLHRRTAYVAPFPHPLPCEASAFPLYCFEASRPSPSSNTAQQRKKNAINATATESHSPSLLSQPSPTQSTSAFDGSGDADYADGDFPFEACFVLNLDKRRDRWEHVLKQIQKHKVASFVRPLANPPDNGAAGSSLLFENGRIQRVPGVDGIALCCETSPFSAVVGKNPPPPPIPSAEKLSRLADANIIAEDARHRLLTVPNADKLFGMDLTPGGVGCALGHMQIWERIVNDYGNSGGDDANDEDVACTDGQTTQKKKKRKFQHFLILEDDVEFAPSFFRTLKKRLSQVPADYEVLYFGGLDLLQGQQLPPPSASPSPFSASLTANASSSPSVVHPRPTLPNRQGIRYAYGGHRELTAYVIRDADVARKMLEMSRPMQWQIDTHITERTAECPLSSSRSRDGGGGNDDPSASSPPPSPSPHGAQIIASPLSYVLQPSLAIQVTSFGTDVQKEPARNATMEDASRRLREFVAGGSSVR